MKRKEKLFYLAFFFFFHFLWHFLGSRRRGGEGGVGGWRG